MKVRLKDGVNRETLVHRANRVSAAKSDRAVTSGQAIPANAATLDRRQASAGSATTATRRP
jgi:hypothetical protein